MAEWSSAYMDDLPDSSFLYIEPGGSKDSDGKTTPRSLRHFPVKDANGNVDLPHVRNALARIPQSNVPASAKEAATRKAQDLLNANDTDMDGRSEAPPRDALVRVSEPFTLTRSSDGAMPVLHGLGATYDEWAEIRSRVEGHFMERFTPGSFRKTISEGRDRIRCIFHHGQDPNCGVKPLGPIVDISERGRGVEYDVELFDADYVRALVPGLEAGVYGSSFNFSIVKKEDERKRVSNPKGLLERTIREASMKELGPTPFPAYSGTSAGLRSITDEFVLARFPAEHLASEAALRTTEQDLVGEIRWLAEKFIASGETDVDPMRSIVSLLDELTGADAHQEDADRTVTSQPVAATTSTGLYGLDRDEEEAWRL